MGKFINFKKMLEDTVAGDIAPVDNAFGKPTKVKHLEKGKKCKKHKKLNCEVCDPESMYRS